MNDIENDTLRNIISCHIQSSTDCTSLILSTESRFCGIISVTKLETGREKTHIFIDPNLVLSICKNAMHYEENTRIK